MSPEQRATLERMALEAESGSGRAYLNDYLQGELGVTEEKCQEMLEARDLWRWLHGEELLTVPHVHATGLFDDEEFWYHGPWLEAPMQTFRPLLVIDSGFGKSHRLALRSFAVLSRRRHGLASGIATFTFELYRPDDRPPFKQPIAVFQSALGTSFGQNFGAFNTPSAERFHPWLVIAVASDLPEHEFMLRACVRRLS